MEEKSAQASALAHFHLGHFAHARRRGEDAKREFAQTRTATNEKASGREGPHYGSSPESLEMASPREALFAQAFPPRPYTTVKAKWEEETKQVELRLNSKEEAKTRAREWSEATGRIVSASRDKKKVRLNKKTSDKTEYIRRSPDEAEASCERVRTAAEMEEARKQERIKAFPRVRNDARTVSYCCGFDPFGCSHFVKWKFLDTGCEPGWYHSTQEFKAHTCTDADLREWRQRSLTTTRSEEGARKDTYTALTTKSCAALLVTSGLMERHQKITVPLVRGALTSFGTPFCYSGLINDTFFRKVIDEARQMVYGDGSLELDRIWAAVQLLRTKGHKAEILSVDGAYQHSLLKKVLKKRYEIRHPRGPGYVEAQDDVLREALKEVKADRDYFYGYSVSLQGVSGGRFQGALQSDACHCKFGKVMDATAFFTVASDALGQTVILAFSVFADTEIRLSWGKHFKFLLEAHPGIDTEEASIISDRDKGLASAISQNFKNALPFFCSWHMNENLRSTSGISSQDRGAYNTALKQLTEGAVIDSIESYSDKMKRYLQNIPFSCLYPAYNKRTWGHTSSQAVEGINGAVKSSRFANNMLESLISLLHGEVTRRDVHKSRTLNAERGEELDAEVKYVETLLERSNLNEWKVTRTGEIDDPIFMQFLISSSLMVTQSYICTIPKIAPNREENALAHELRHLPTCTCGRFQVTKRLCEHLLALFDERGLEWIHYLHPIKSLDGHRYQYRDWISAAPLASMDIVDKAKTIPPEDKLLPPLISFKVTQRRGRTSMARVRSRRERLAQEARSSLLQEASTIVNQAARQVAASTTRSENQVQADRGQEAGVPVPEAAVARDDHPGQAAAPEPEASDPQGDASAPQPQASAPEAQQNRAPEPQENREKRRRVAPDRFGWS